MDLTMRSVRKSLTSRHRRVRQTLSGAPCGGRIARLRLRRPLIKVHGARLTSSENLADPLNG